MGREMAAQIEESYALTYAQYVLPEHVKTLNEELFVQEDLYLGKTTSSLSLLHAIQADLLMMRNPQGLPPTQLEESAFFTIAHCSKSKEEKYKFFITIC